MTERHFDPDTTSGRELAVEEMIDAAGISNVIDAVAQVCFAKAEHLKGNWQDPDGSRAWRVVAKRVDTLAGSEAVINLSAY